VSKQSSVSQADKLKFIGLICFFVLLAALSVYIIQFVRHIGDQFPDLAAQASALAAEEGLPLWQATAELYIQHAVADAGIFGILICLALQFVQIVVAFIPGEAAQIAIGYVYGTVGGGLITLFGACLSSAFVFFLVRRLGAPFVQAMIGAKDSKRMDWLKDSKRLNSTVFILFLIPGLPKDLFTYVVPLTQMRPAAFLVLSTIARAPAIFASTFVAAAFRDGNYVAMAVVALVFGGIGILGIVFNTRIMALVDKLLARLQRRPQPSVSEGDGSD